ncbi:MAG TPA: esterase-like activity of phytase family protein, partial [Planctomycetota bacterium]|nr:esterase-like activity of phytase family protein [Planctomycetota bacterium]
DLKFQRYTSTWHRYPLDQRGQAIGDFIMFAPQRGLVIERDNTQGDLRGFKAIYEIGLVGSGQAVSKRLAVDLLAIDDPARISLPGLNG